MGNSSNYTKKDPERAHLDRVHLIVHPGDGLSDKNIDAENVLLQAMAARAVSLEKRSEVAVVLLQMNADELRRVSDPGYTGKERILTAAIRRIQEEIPGNVIIVSGAPSTNPVLLDPIFADIQRKIDAFGFIIDEKTDVLSYGEMAAKCVSQASGHFVNHFGITRTPVVDLNLTEVSICETPEQWMRNGIRLSYVKILNGPGLKYIPLGETEAEK